MVIWLQKFQDENGWVSVLIEKKEKREKKTLWKAQYPEKLSQLREE